MEALTRRDERKAKDLKSNGDPTHPLWPTVKTRSHSRNELEGPEVIS